MKDNNEIWMPEKEKELLDDMTRKMEQKIWEELWKNEQLYKAQQILEEIKKHQKD
jgi:hypothetical protein